MKYLGRFSGSSIPVSKKDFGQLFAYTSNNVEIVIFYDMGNPFYVRYIALLITTPNIYDVYKYDYYLPTDDDAKDFIKNLVERCLKQNNGPAPSLLGECNSIH